MMKAIARRTGTYTHEIDVRDHRLAADEGHDVRRRGRGPESAGAARREPRLLHGDHGRDVRQAQGLGHRQIEVEAEYTPAERGAPTRFKLLLRLPRDLTSEQVERLSVIAAKCPIHRTLDGEVMFDERIELVG